MGDPIVIIPPGGYWGGDDPCSGDLGQNYQFCGIDGGVEGGVDCCYVPGGG